MKMQPALKQVQGDTALNMQCDKAPPQQRSLYSFRSSVTLNLFQGSVTLNLFQGSVTLNLFQGSVTLNLFQGGIMFKTSFPTTLLSYYFCLMKRFWKIIWPYLRNKYVLAIAGFIIWIAFFSQYSLVDQRKLSRNLKQLEQEKRYYIEQVRRDSTRLHELTTDKENLEKFAREQYYMKKANEDIFVIIE